MESWSAGVEDPAIFAVKPPKPVLHAEEFPLVEGLAIGGKATLKIIRVHTIRPAVPQFQLEWPPCRACRVPKPRLRPEQYWQPVQILWHCLAKRVLRGRCIGGLSGRIGHPVAASQHS